MLARLRNQDAEGWRTFVTLYAPLVVRWCKRQGLDEHDTADLAQDVFRKVAEHIDGFHKQSPSDSLRGWLCRITHHAIVDFARRRERLVAAGGSEAMLRLNGVADRPIVEPDEKDSSEETRYLFQQAM